MHTYILVFIVRFIFPFEMLGSYPFEHTIRLMKCVSALFDSWINDIYVQVKQAIIGLDDGLVQ